MFCQFCGKNLEGANVRFCPSCGKKIEFATENNIEKTVYKEISEDAIPKKSHIKVKKFKIVFIVLLVLVFAYVVAFLAVRHVGLNHKIQENLSPFNFTSVSDTDAEKYNSENADATEKKDSQFFEIFKGKDTTADDFKEFFTKKGLEYSEVSLVEGEEYQILKTTDLDMMYGGNCYYFVYPKIYASVDEKQVLQDDTVSAPQIESIVRSVYPYNIYGVSAVWSFDDSDSQSIKSQLSRIEDAMNEYGYEILKIDYDVAGSELLDGYALLYITGVSENFDDDIYYQCISLEVDDLGADSSLADMWSYAGLIADKLIVCNEMFLSKESVDFIREEVASD